VVAIASPGAAVVGSVVVEGAHAPRRDTMARIANGENLRVEIMCVVLQNSGRELASCLSRKEAIPVMSAHTERNGRRRETSGRASLNYQPA
jgi:hypothetical protein